MEQEQQVRIEQEQQARIQQEQQVRIEREQQARMGSPHARGEVRKITILRRLLQKEIDTLQRNLEETKSLLDGRLAKNAARHGGWDPTTDCHQS
jgi:hypothetical protein